MNLSSKSAHRVVRELDFLELVWAGVKVSPHPLLCSGGSGHLKDPELMRLSALSLGLCLQLTQTSWLEHLVMYRTKILFNYCLSRLGSRARSL